ncbi:MAG: HAMP domain-containing histidine kinase [Oscillospiraceae bacterium]|nr:HAMP domain-containing histidine kinase [Oscillospiraceae bacterium]
MKKKKTGLGIMIYFTLLIMLVITLTLGFAELITYILNYYFHRGLIISSTGWLMLFSIILGMVFGRLASSLVLSPITRLGKAMETVSKRDFSVRLKTKSLITEVRDIYDNFNLMTSELGAVEELQTNFVSSVSHEFKTPINAIEGYAMLLQEKNIPEDEQEEYVNKILFNTKRLSELVGNILLLSKLENQAIPAKKEPFRLDEQIRRAILLLESKWSAKDILFDIDLEETVYSGAEGLLLHIWVNLIDNAIKFSEKGGSIKMTLREKKDSVIFTIEDNGCGISEEDINRIFNRFYQSDSSRKDEGSGLGLALVKQITELSGGTVDVKSVLGKGSRFTLTLMKE